MKLFPKSKPSATLPKDILKFAAKVENVEEEVMGAIKENKKPKTSIAWGSIDFGSAPIGTVFTFRNQDTNTWTLPTGIQ